MLYVDLFIVAEKHPFSVSRCKGNTIYLYRKRYIYSINNLYNYIACDTIFMYSHQH